MQRCNLSTSTSYIHVTGVKLVMSFFTLSGGECKPLTHASIVFGFRRLHFHPRTLNPQQATCTSRRWRPRVRRHCPRPPPLGRTTFLRRRWSLCWTFQTWRLPFSVGVLTTFLSPPFLPASPKTNGFELYAGVRQWSGDLWSIQTTRDVQCCVLPLSPGKRQSCYF